MLGKVDELAIQDENIAIPFTVGETVKVVEDPSMVSTELSRG